MQQPQLWADWLLFRWVLQLLNHHVDSLMRRLVTGVR